MVCYLELQEEITDSSQHLYYDTSCQITFKGGILVGAASYHYTGMAIMVSWYLTETGSLQMYSNSGETSQKVINTHQL